MSRTNYEAYEAALRATVAKGATGIAIKRREAWYTRAKKSTGNKRERALKMAAVYNSMAAHYGIEFSREGACNGN